MNDMEKNDIIAGQQALLDQNDMRQYENTVEEVILEIPPEPPDHIPFLNFHLHHPSINHPFNTTLIPTSPLTDDSKTTTSIPESLPSLIANDAMYQEMAYYNSDDSVPSYNTLERFYLGALQTANIKSIQQTPHQIIFDSGASTCATSDASIIQITSIRKIWTFRVRYYSYGKYA
jgi:hypothetical protein